MNLIRRIILLLSIFCVSIPARAMDAGEALDSLKRAGSAAGSIVFLYFCAVMARMMLEDIREDMGWRTREKWQPWIDAACDPDLEVTRALLAKEGYLREKDYNGNTPLHWAAIRNQEEKVKLLLAHGAEVTATYNKQDTPLYDAALIGCVESVRCILQRATFNPVKTIDSESLARIKEALLVCVRNKLPRDVRKKIISFLHEDIRNQAQCRLAFTYGANLKELVAQCPLEWFLHIYDSFCPEARAQFLNVVVPAITEYRMSKVRELLADQKLQAINPVINAPIILAMLDVTNVEQHHAAIEQNVREAFTSRVFQKHPKLKLINVNQGIQDVMNDNSDLPGRNDHEFN